MNRYAALLFYFLFGLSATAQVRIEVVRYPKLLAPNAPLFLAGDVNGWNPGDPNFAFKRDKTGVFYLDLPEAPDRFEYKITQGSWTLVEGTAAREIRTNRVYDRRAEVNPARVQVVVEGWEKKASYSFVVKKLPENTPHDASVYICGNFNNWNSGSPIAKLQPNVDGTYRITVYSDLPRLEFKFTRGTWPSVEARESGKARPNRVILRNATIDHDAIEVEIAGWEDLASTFRFYSLYDLLLLFSAFQGLLLIIAIPTIQNYNRRANRWLVITIAAASLALLVQVVGSYREVAQAFTKILLLPDFILFLYAPLFYFYLQKLLFNVNSLSSRWWYHFIPTIGLFFAYLPYFLMNASQFQSKVINQAWDLRAVFLSVGLLALAWNTYYWVLFRRAISFYREQYRSNYSYEQNLNYLSTVLVIQAVCLCLWLFTFGVMGLGRVFSFEVFTVVERSIDGIWLAFSTITYFVGYFAIHQPETFKVAPQTFSIFDDVLESPVRTDGMLAEKPAEVGENLQPWKEKVEAFMQKNKTYTNPQLSLAELATKLKMPPHLLSKVINEGFDKNFFDFVNTYRIEEFKRRVEDPRFKHYTLLSIAYDVGFNSKTAFNRSFKKITNQTPREYFNLANEVVE